ncbi:MAG TPA: methyltransferase domain-containing protein [Thermoanaerobaculia bacterium]|nr:methyltransferase domain-containing protein [Thermoanaerobaculia bacterium]
MPNDWWKDFFSGLIVDFWQAVIPEETTKAEADFLEKHLQLSSPGARVLDVPCGGGRLAIELAARGCRLVAVDISPQFLEAGREAARERGFTVEWRQADMRDLPWRGEFDAVYCAGSSFGFLGDEGDREFLSAVARALKPGGRLFADFKAADSILPNFRERYEMRIGDIEFQARNAYDPVTATMRSDYIVSRGDRVEKKAALHRIYTTREILRLLEHAGFSSVQTFGSIEGEPFRLSSPTLVVVAEGVRSPLATLGVRSPLATSLREDGKTITADRALSRSVKT